MLAGYVFGKVQGLYLAGAEIAKEVPEEMGLFVLLEVEEVQQEAEARVADEVLVAVLAVLARLGSLDCTYSSGYPWSWSSVSHEVILAPFLSCSLPNQNGFS